MTFHKVINKHTTVEEVALYVSRFPESLISFDELNETLLMKSLIVGNHDVSLFLLDNGADANLFKGLKIPLELASAQWDDEVMKRLLEETSNETLESNFAKYSIMAELIYYRHSEEEVIYKLGFLLDHGFSPNEKYSTEARESIFSYACHTTGEPFEIVKFLIKAGANINHLDGSGRNPIYFTISFRRRIIFDLLIHNGARISKENMKYLTKSGNYHWLHDKLDYLTDEEKYYYDENRLLDLLINN